jgi:DNA-binding MarR family transcriptional regulator
VDDPIGDDDFRTLARFRKDLRDFLQFSEAAALSHGLTPQQYQALLAIRGSERQRMQIGDLAEALLIRPHSASELVSRLEKLGMVERREVEEDGRGRSVLLMAAALTLLNTLSAAHRTELRRLRPLLVGLLERLG